MKNIFGNWKIGKIGGAVVSDKGFRFDGGHDDEKYYDGHLIAESIPDEKCAALIACAPELLQQLIENIEGWEEAEGAKPTIEEKELIKKALNGDLSLLTENQRRLLQ